MDQQNFDRAAAAGFIRPIAIAGSVPAMAAQAPASITARDGIFPDIGLSVTPKKGAVVYFEYCNSQNQVDRLTLHAGKPVVAGEKWIATKWMRQRRYG